MKRIQFFFDESGKSGLTSNNGGQPHLILAGILVPWESLFWDDVKAAWDLSAELLSVNHDMVELHGWELYGNKGPWLEVRKAKQILDIIFTSLKKHNIIIYWAGLPVTEMTTIKDKKWESILITYLDFLHRKFSTLPYQIPIEVYGDENDWVKADKALMLDKWTMFANKQVGFKSSAEVHGIQIADIVAHTLYRFNKKTLSQTDRAADEYRASISSQIIFLDGLDTKEL